MNKDLINREVTAAMEVWSKWNPDLPVHKACLYWADLAVQVLGRHKLDAQINAGTAQWRVCEDDGVNPDWFGYVFEWNHESRVQYALGTMPEMHAWAVVVGGDPQIIDFTPRFVRRNAAEAGVTVDREFPDYYWFGLSQIPDGVYYRASQVATALAHKMLT